MAERIKKGSSWDNPWIMLTGGLGALLFVVGLVMAVQADQALASVTWDGADADALRRREDVGQTLITASAVLVLAWVVLLGVRWEADRVVAAVRKSSLRADRRVAEGTRAPARPDGEG